jgi:5'-3' exonuclease
MRWPLLLLFMSLITLCRVRSLKTLAYRGNGRLLSSTALASETTQKSSPSSNPGYFAKDLPDETFYVFDGTAMLFQAHYSRESRMAHGESFLSPSLSQELRDLLEIDEEKYALHLEEMLGEVHDSSRNPSTLHCGALTVMSMNFVRFIRELKPRYVAVAFDAGSTTFRNSLYDSYKLDRKEAPLSLQPLFRLAPLVMEELGGRCFQKPGYEADDVIASLSEWGRRKGLNVVIVSVDKDMLQLIDTGVHVLNPFVKERRIIGSDEVFEKYAVTPESLVDYQALMGDTSDGVPGVKGVGPKAAATVLGHFGSIEAMLASLKVPAEPVDFECRDSLEQRGFVIDEKLTAKKQKAAAKALAKATLEGKGCKQSATKLYVQIPPEQQRHLDACLEGERLGSYTLYESLLSCGSDNLALYKKLVTLERNLDVRNTLYDRTKPQQPFTTKERKVDEKASCASEDRLLSVERLSLSLDGAEKEAVEQEDGEEEEEDMPTSKLRFVGERSPLAGDVLVEISSSLETPLRLLRQIYSRLDRL